MRDIDRLACANAGSAGTARSTGVRVISRSRDGRRRRNQTVDLFMASSAMFRPRSKSLASVLLFYMLSNRQKNKRQTLARPKIAIFCKAGRNKTDSSASVLFRASSIERYLLQACKQQSVRPWKTGIYAEFARRWLDVKRFLSTDVCGAPQP